MPQAKANGILIEYELQGPPDGDPLLLIMGLGAQLTRWGDLAPELARRGFRVITYDNRDVGLSEKLDHAGVPDFPAVLEAVRAGGPAPVAYTLKEMADDAVGLLDALDVPRAHIVGASMGGMIAQLIAADHPERTLSLTSIMSTSGHPSLPWATPEALAVLSNRGPDPRQDREGYLAHAVSGARVLGSPAYPTPEPELRARLSRDLDRNFHPDGFARQYAAVLASPDRTPKLGGVRAPTVVIHGEDDPLVRADCGRHTAQSIPDAELLVIRGMGHDVPTALVADIADAVEGVARRARAAA